MTTHHVDRANFNHRIHELRGVAVLGVVAHHVNPSLLPGGFSGVDVFLSFQVTSSPFGFAKGCI